MTTSGMTSVGRRAAAGVAGLALAFSLVASTEPAANADTAKPATGISAVPQSGVAPSTLSSVQVSGSFASIHKKASKKKKKKKKKSKGTKALAFAKRQLGDRYRWGGTGPNSWDCSGLTRGAWKAAGKKVPRTSQAQARHGKKVSRSQLRKGDLVFFYSGKSHVAIYAGHGKVIHASRPGKPVAYIKMKYMPYAGARRPA
ncbi:MAG: NlpC/P60 family protein [Microlunatus sp.]|nr:NlpC/P60 family protein [Microlunatus sp.]